MRHTGIARFRGLTRETAGEVQEQGRKLLGALMGRLKLSGVSVGKMERLLPDRTRIIAQYDGTTPMVTAIAPVSTAEDDAIERAAAWVPRGFVVYPVSDASPKGWGAPVVQVTDDATPYDRINTAPGLDVERWTEGGALGQVLLTQVPDAGYPRQGDARLTSPVLFHPTAGIRPQAAPPAPTVEWTAFRLEFDAFSAQSPGASEGTRSTITAFKRRSYELVNEHREGIGREPMLLPLRGYYDSAQATAECCAAASIAGHFWQGFPVTYRTAEDRMGKDGITLTVLLPDLTPTEYDDRNVALSGGENITANGDKTLVATDPNGIGIYSVTDQQPISAQLAFDQWMSSPDHSGQIENPIYDIGGLGLLSASSLLPGVHGAFAVQHFIAREQWIASGNMTWQSMHEEIPALSWCGFNALSLGFETWPIDPIYESVDEGGGVFSLAVSIYTGARKFVTAPGGSPLPRIVYVDHPEVSGTADRRTRPAMSPRIFMRGRCIAVAPRGGLVWAAAVQKLPLATPDSAQVYRLIALVHHLADQPVDDTANGMTANLRVWHCDLPDFPNFAANPQTMIRGVYGEEDAGTWPWLTLNSPYSWRGGVLVDMATRDGSGEPDMLKLAAQWRFSPDGTKASCLRDLGTMDEWQAHLLNDGGRKFGDGGFDPFTTTLPGPVVYQPAGMFGHLTGGPNVVHVELTLTPDGDSVDVARAVSAPSAGAVTQRLVAPAEDEVFASIGPAAWIRPCAVDYLANGTLAFAYHVTAYYGSSHEVPSEAGTVLIPNLRQGVWFGAWDARWPHVALTSTWYSALADRADSNETMFATPASVIDVRDRVFAAMGRFCPMVDVGPHPSAPPGFENYPDFAAPSSFAVYREGLFSAACLACENVPSEFIVRLWREGVLLFDEAVTNPNNVLMDLRLMPVSTQYGDPAGTVTSGYFWWVQVPESLNLTMNACYVRDRDGEWLATLLVLPQPGITTVFNPAGDTTLFPATQFYSSQCVNGCGVSPRRAVTFVGGGHGIARDGGGAMQASFANEGELAERMQIPGDNPRSLYARLV